MTDTSAPGNAGGFERRARETRPSASGVPRAGQAGLHNFRALRCRCRWAGADATSYRSIPTFSLCLTTARSRFGGAGPIV